MATDSKNITRLDLEDIYDDAKTECFHTCQALGLDTDIFGISEADVPVMHRFAMEGASKIADEASMLKHFTQTGIDGLTYYDEYENPSTYDTDGDGDLEGTEGVDVECDDLTGETHDTGEKLTKDTPDYVLFSIDGLEDDQIRYTAVQQFIKMALINYILMRWWAIKAQYQQSQANQILFEQALRDVNFNSIRNNGRKDGKIPLNELPI